MLSIARRSLQKADLARVDRLIFSLTLILKVCCWALIDWAADLGSDRLPAPRTSDLKQPRREPQLDASFLSLR